MACAAAPQASQSGHRPRWRQAVGPKGCTDGPDLARSVSGFAGVAATRQRGPPASGAGIMGIPDREPHAQANGSGPL